MYFILGSKRSRRKMFKKVRMNVMPKMMFPSWPVIMTGSRPKDARYPLTVVVVVN